MPDTPSARFDFEAPSDHLAYYREIAAEMAQRWPIDFAAAVAALNARVRNDDHFGPHAWLLFHEDPWYWADLSYQQQVLGNWDYHPGSPNVEAP